MANCDCGHLTEEGQSDDGEERHVCQGIVCRCNIVLQLVDKCSEILDAERFQTVSTRRQGQDIRDVKIWMWSMFRKYWIYSCKIPYEGCHISVKYFLYASSHLISTVILMRAGTVGRPVIEQSTS